MAASWQEKEGQSGPNGTDFHRFTCGERQGDTSNAADSCILSQTHRDKFGGRIDSNTDVIYGKESWETNGGRDVIKGLGGSDTIYANSGNDIIDAGTGDDLINSGFGDDIFYFGQNSGYDTIKDFGHSTGNRDKIVVDGIYNGYYKSPFTGEVVLKFDHNRDGSTDARVLLSGVGESEWLSTGM